MKLNLTLILRLTLTLLTTFTLLIPLNPTTWWYIKTVSLTLQCVPMTH